MPSVRPGDVTAGHPVNLQQPGTLLVVFFFIPLAEKWEDSSKARGEGGGTHGEAGTHTVQEAFGERVELRLPHRAAAQGSSGRTEEGEVQRRAGGCRQQHGTAQGEK